MYLRGVQLTEGCVMSQCDLVFSHHPADEDCFGDAVSEAWVVTAQNNNGIEWLSKNIPAEIHADPERTTENGIGERYAVHLENRADFDRLRHKAIGDGLIIGEPTTSRKSTRSRADELRASSGYGPKENPSETL